MKKAIPIEIIQKGDKFEIKTDMPMIPTEIVQTLVDEIYKRGISQSASAFFDTKDGEFVGDLIMKLKHYKFWNRVLYILCIAVVVFFVFFAR